MIVCIDAVVRVPNMTPEYRDRVSETIFRAYTSESADPIGHLIIDHFTERNPVEMRDSFFTDPRTKIVRPWVYSVSVLSPFHKHGVATSLAIAAIEYYRINYDLTVFTGILNSPAAVKLWESLTRKGFAQECSYKENRRWKLISV